MICMGPTSFARFVTHVKSALAAKQEKVSGITVELTVANWANNAQTVNAVGVTATAKIIVSPAPASLETYAAAGVYCSAQGAGTLTFACSAVPDAAVSVNIYILG